MADFKDIVRLFRSLSEEEKENLNTLSRYLDGSSDVKYFERLLKQKKIKIHITPADEVGIPGNKIPFVSIKTLAKDPDLKQSMDELNNNISKRNQKELFHSFATVASDVLQESIAPGIVGFDLIKKAVAIQLFSNEKIHILLLGDPGTGKTKILSSATDIHPISSMGLGSGTSSAGLAVTMKGNEVMPGLLPMADQGLCAIDELNLMKDESRASLYNAMESGFVSYDKGGHHYKFDARVSVLATANPKGDKFKGVEPNELKKQLPFDPALLSRFHLTFLVRRPGVEKFKDISRNLLAGKKHSVDENKIKFLQSYIGYANKMKEPRLPKRFEQEVVDFVGHIKQNEKDYLIEVSPRLVIGFMRMAKALARSELREEVEDKDIQTVKDIITASLKIA